MCSSCEGFVPALLLPGGLDFAAAFLAANAARATVILGAAFGAAWLLRRKSAAVRHLAWSAAVICVLLLPAASLLLPNWSSAWPDVSEAAGVAVRTPGAGRMLAVVDAPVALSGDPASAVGAQGGTLPVSALPVAAILLAVWVIGCCLVAARVLAGARGVGAMARNAQPLTGDDWSRLSSELAGLLSLSRPVALLRSPLASIPMTAGMRRPVILLPQDAEQWSGERRRVVLAHELLHVQRGDYGLWMLARLACAFYWFHPLVWLAAARLRREAEQACDDGVLRLGAEAPAYAEHLVSLARGWSLARTAELSAMAMAQPSHLENRIRALLDPTRSRGDASRRSRWWMALAAVMVLTPLAAVRAPAQAAGASLQGAVSDASGARVPRVFVTVQRVGEPSKAVAIADEAGEFTFPSLPAGDYVVEIRAPGFRIQQQRLQLLSGAQESLDITVDIGAVVEEVVIVGKSQAEEGPRRSGPPRRIRVGGNIQRSKLITQIEPVYPEELQREGVEGMVVLEAVILTDGSLGDVKLANDLVAVDQRLVSAATEAVRFWRYAPTLLNGVPVEVTTTITLNFQLER